MPPSARSGRPLQADEEISVGKAKVVNRTGAKSPRTPQGRRPNAAQSAPINGITNYGHSPLQAHADVVLYTMARETRFRTEAMTSRIAQLCVVDALISGPAQSWRQAGPCRREGHNLTQAAACLRRRSEGATAPSPLISSHTAAGSGTGEGANALKPGLPTSPVPFARIAPS